jgi:hypothetical protein
VLRNKHAHVDPDSTGWSVYLPWVCMNANRSSILLNETAYQRWWVDRREAFDTCRLQSKCLLHVGQHCSHGKNVRKETFADIQYVTVFIDALLNVIDSKMVTAPFPFHLKTAHSS